ncbi:ABC transporter ATP-binding protein [Glycomyces albus]
MTEEMIRNTGLPGTEAANSNTIRVEGLSKSYGDVQALRGVDLDVEQGEVFGLLGPNGAGKTTLTEILEGHIKPTSGKVRVLDMEPGKAGRAVRDRLGIVPQKASFELYLTVREHLAVFAGYYSRSYPVDDLIELVGLGPSSKVRVGRLSGGQQRRLDLALALVGDPDMVFLDEPTTGLDIEARDRAWETIQAMRDAGKTVFMTTHNMVEAQRLCDRVAIMQAGEIAAVGTSDQLVPDEGRAVISFHAKDVDIESLPEDLFGSARAAGGRIILNTDDIPRVLHRLTGWALDNDLPLGDLEVRRLDLEELYLSILARRESEGTAR